MWWPSLGLWCSYPAIGDGSVDRCGLSPLSVVLLKEKVIGMWGSRAKVVALVACASSVAACGGQSDTEAGTQPTVQVADVTQGSAAPTTSTPPADVVDGPKPDVVDSRHDLPAKALAEAQGKESVSVGNASDVVWAKCMKDAGFPVLEAPKQTVDDMWASRSGHPNVGVEGSADSALQVKIAEERAAASNLRKAPAGVDPATWLKAGTGSAKKRTIDDISNMSPADFKGGCNGAFDKAMAGDKATAKDLNTKAALFLKKHGKYTKQIAKHPEVVALQQAMKTCLESKGHKTEALSFGVTQIDHPTPAVADDPVTTAKKQAESDKDQIACQQETDGLKKFFSVVHKMQTDLLANPEAKADFETSVKAHNDLAALYDKVAAANR